MKHPYLKKEDPDYKDNCHNEMTNSLKTQFPGKIKSTKVVTKKEFTGEKQTDSVMIHDIFGALNY